MNILKTLLQDGIAFLKSDKAQLLADVTPVLDTLANDGVAAALALVGKITNPLVKSVLTGLINEYGPELPKLIAQYEGPAYDALVSFLEAEVAKLP